jgi:hypothetical protein
MQLIRGQSGIEFAVFFGFLIFFFVIFSIEAADRTSAISRNRMDFDAEKVGGTAATNINIAFSVGDGYSAIFYLPYGLTDSNYTFVIFKPEQRLEIDYGQNYFKTFPLLTSNITGNLTQGMNKIKNSNGGIIFG